jgi:ubiquinone/menaquinone biosynthesis C-methylase UbiE
MLMRLVPLTVPHTAIDAARWRVNLPTRGNGLPAVVRDRAEHLEVNMSIFSTMMSLPEVYERFLVKPLFRPFAEELLARAEPAGSESLLDVACGTGVVARVARERLGPQARVVGVDVSAPMLAVARGADRTIEWREGNAVALPLGDGEQFTIVTCHQGLQFMPDKLAAVRQMRNALGDGGRIAIGTWLGVADIPFARELDEVAQRHAGPFVDLRHSFGDAGALRRVLDDAGFTSVQVETVSHDVRMDDGPLYARLNAMAVVGMSPAAKTMDEAQRTELAGRIAEDSFAVVARFTDAGALVFELTTLIATARA